MSIIDDLIFDRTNLDLVVGNPKGKYDYVDYNRVGTAINYVADEIGGLSITAKTDWVNTDIPRNGDITAYRGYVQTIIDSLDLSYVIPANNNDVLTISGANQLEKALYDAHNTVINIMRWNDVDELGESWDTLDAKGKKWGSYFLKSLG